MSKVKVKLFKSSGTKLISKQDNSSYFTDIKGIIEPQYSFESMLYAYDNNPILAGIIKKISNSANVGFKPHDNPIIQNFLKNLDIVVIFSNLLIFGNSFMERLKDGFGNPTLNLKKILTFTINIANGKEKDVAYIQVNKDNNLKEIKYNKDEVLFIQRESVGDNNYGDSIFYNCIDEVILLAYITKYYKKFFQRGNIEPNVLYDESGTLTDEQTDKIEQMIQDKISGIDSANTTIFVTGKIGKIDLSAKIDPDKFIQLKKILREEIAIATNIPYSLLSPENSNRAIASADFNSLYSDIIIPMQDRFLQQLKQQLLSWKIEGVSYEDIDKIAFLSQSLDDDEKEMKILTGYQKTGVLSINEVRVKAELGDAVEGGDEHKAISGGKEEIEVKEEQEMKKIREKISKIYKKT